MADNFSSFAPGLEAPASRYFAITPSNSTDFDYNTRAIYVGSSGNLVAVDDAGTTCTFSNVPAGTILPIRAKRVNSTNTTASNLVGMY